MRDSWIICVLSWKFRFPEVSPTMTDSKRDAWILLKFVRETGSRSPLCHPLRMVTSGKRLAYLVDYVLTCERGFQFNSDVVPLLELEDHQQISSYFYAHPLSLKMLSIECVRSCDQKPYLHNETKGGICIKIEFNPQKNISLFQHGCRFFVYSSNMAAVTSYEHTLFISIDTKRCNFEGLSV